MQLECKLTISDYVASCRIGEGGYKHKAKSHFDLQWQKFGKLSCECKLKLATLRAQPALICVADDIECVYVLLCSSFCFEVVLDQGEDSLNIYKLQSVSVCRGAYNINQAEEPHPSSSPPIQTKQMVKKKKVIFQMATVKGVFVSSKICSYQHLHECS